MDPNTNHIRKIRFYGTFNYRPIAIFAIGLLLGILAIRLSSQLFIIAAALCTVTTMLAFRLKRKFVFLLSIAALFGMFRVCILRPAVYTIEDDSPFVEGTVHSIIEDNLILSSVSLNSMPVEGHMLIKNMQHSLKVGDTVCLTASVEQTSELRESTYKYYLLSENYTFVATPLYPIRTTGHTTSLHSAFAEAHNTLSCKIDSLFGSSSQIVKGILLGDTSQIPDDTLGNLQDTGIAHLLALSGLHVSILAGALSFALKRVNKYVKTGIIFTFLLVYCAITAFPASLVRASIMTAISMTAPLFNRRNDSLTSCAIALIVILVINPFQLFAAGFVLSFCAVTGIILMYKPFCNMFATVTEP